MGRQDKEEENEKDDEDKRDRVRRRNNGYPLLSIMIEKLIMTAIIMILTITVFVTYIKNQ